MSEAKEEQKVTTGLVVQGAFMFSMLGAGLFAFGSLVYDLIDDRYPNYKAGTCLKTVDNRGNEFEPRTYDYAVIREVGKERYKVTRVYYSGKYLNSYETTMKFSFLDRYSEPQVINCNELAKILDDYIRSQEQGI